MTDIKRIPLGPCLVVMIGPSGAGKSTFIKKHFEQREVVSSDGLREELTGDFRRQDKNDLVFEEFANRIKFKLKAGQRVVADATHLQRQDRMRTAEFAKTAGVPLIYVVVNRPVEEKIKTGEWRNSVKIGKTSLIERHEETFRSNIRDILSGDGIADLIIDTRVGSKDLYRVIYHPDRVGKFGIEDITDWGFNKIRVVGDVHGNLSGLQQSMDCPDDTLLLFLGDIVDYGRETVETVQIVSDLVKQGKALCLRGNHEKKISNYIVQNRTSSGFRGKISHGNDVTINRLNSMSYKDRVRFENAMLDLVDNSPDWIQLGSNHLFVHGAATPSMWENTLFRSPKGSYLETMAIYGETDGTKNPEGLPNRTYNWVDNIPFGKTVTVGHSIRSTLEPVVEISSTGGVVIFLDTGSSKRQYGILGKLSWIDFGIIPTDDGSLTLCRGSIGFER